ncbi:MAG: hypothetical protein WEE36_08705 [Acidimicrobiia bacterium]
MTDANPPAHHDHDSATTLTRDHTCFDDVVALLADVTAYMYLVDTIRTGTASVATESFYGNFASKIDGADRGFYPFELTRHLAANTWPDSITIYDNLATVRAPKGPPLTGSEHQKLVRQMVGGPLIRYYETYIPQVLATHGTDPTNWPEPWDFARVVRNAFAHKGTIHFESATARSVSWHGLVLSPSMNGHEILFPILGIGDILLLMIEMDTALRP